MTCVSCADLSGGTENVPVFFERSDSEKLPVFQYTPENVSGPGCDADPSQLTLPGCGCHSLSCQQGSCSCLQRHGQAYDAAGHWLDQLADAVEYSRPVFECNASCGCAESCSNRVVEQGLKLRLQVFSTQGKGWGLRALEPVPRGTFVCEYAGEVIGFEEACRRQGAQNPGDMNYIIAVREHTAAGCLCETFVDPAAVGNVGRFLNHSCLPNLSMVPVRVHSMVPRLALFAVRDICPLEELTFDYSGGYNNPRVTTESPAPSPALSLTQSHSVCGSGVTGTLKRKLCLCGTQSCRLFLPLDVSIISSN